MSKGSPRIVIRLTPDEMVFVQAAADTTSVDIKKLAKMGVLREAMDVRNKLIEHLKQEKQRRETAGTSDSSVPVQDVESQSVSSNTLYEQSQASHDSGAGTQP